MTSTVMEAHYAVSTAMLEKGFVDLHRVTTGHLRVPCNWLYEKSTEIENATAAGIGGVGMNDEYGGKILTVL